MRLVFVFITSLALSTWFIYKYRFSIVVPLFNQVAITVCIIILVLLVYIAFLNPGVPYSLMEEVLVYTLHTGMITLVFMIFYFDALAPKKEPVVEPAPPAPPPEPEKPAEPDYTIPFSTRFRHTLILGMTGAGKSVLLAKLIQEDMQKPCSVVVFDSKGDLIKQLLRLDYPRERIVLINPSDVEFPVALSLFARKERKNKYEEEQHLNTTIELLSYTLNTMGASVTSKQELPLRMLIRLCLAIPNATLHTLRELLVNYGKYAQYIETLPPVAQSFFKMEWSGRHYQETKDQLLRRVTAILENDALARMFSSPTSKLDMKRVLDEGSIVLINSAKQFLKEENSAFFSRFMISMITHVMQEREDNPDNMPVFVYIDEASPIIDHNISTLLETARSASFGITLAFQQLSQIPTDLQDAIITNTATRYMGRISAKDARRIAPEMHTNHDTLMMTPKFSFYQNVTDGFKRIYKAPTLYDLPQRSDMKLLVEENRAKYCVRAENKPIPTQDLTLGDKL